MRFGKLFASSCVAVLLVGGCSKPAPVPASTAAAATAHFPARPSVAPPAIKLFHQSYNTLTLVTDENATNEQIEAIIWQLRDAANTHTFDALKLPQKLIDARSPYIWMHIYRGAKCASEKYTTGKYPCGASYHAAGEFTYGSVKDPNRTDGELVVDENHSTPLWDSNTK